ncbi:MAG: ABC transporter substrate-binding protein, partial [Pseudomonadales bacterium]
MMKTSKTLKLLTLASLAWLAACSDDDTGPGTPNAAANAAPQQIYQWRLATTWPKNFPGMGVAPEKLADRVKQMSNGRLIIKVFGAGEIVPALEVFEAVSQGTVQMGHGAAYYWKGKVPMAQFFTTAPFGMTAQEINGWLLHGGGMELWREIYEPYNLIPMVGG